MVDFSDDVHIKGATDEELIGNVGPRLMVDALAPNVPSTKVVYESVHVENGGSRSMTVDGSVTPVEFMIGPPAGEIWYIFELGVEISDQGNNTITSFGAINAGLTNGLDIEQHVDSVDYLFVNLKTNLDIVSVFSDHSFRGQANSFLNSTNFYAGKVELRQAVTLVGDDGDEIRFIVNDDLEGLDTLEGIVEYYRVVG